MGLKNKVVRGVKLFCDHKGSILREVCQQTPLGQREYKKRTAAMASRQFNDCAICELPMMDPEFDHEAGRGFNGSHRDDRIVDENGRPKNAAVHHDCNIAKGSRRYIWLRGKYRPIAEALETARAS